MLVDVYILMKLCSCLTNYEVRSKKKVERCSISKGDIYIPIFY